jgi:hypothetical protein
LRVDKAAGPLAEPWSAPHVRRFRLFLSVLPVVAVIAAAKALLHFLGFEVLTLDGIIPSIVTGAIFLIGFLLSHVLSDYREMESTVSDMRVALESIYSDIVDFGRMRPEVDVVRIRAFLVEFVRVFEFCLGRAHAHSDLAAAIAKNDGLGDIIAEMDALGMSGRYIVRLRGAHDVLRHALFRISYVQRMEFAPSVHVMVQTLVFSCLMLMLLLKTGELVEGILVVGFVSYMFVYALFLIHLLEKPFRKGEATADDVSIFLLREFAAKLAAMETREETVPVLRAMPPV